MKYPITVFLSIFFLLSACKDPENSWVPKSVIDSLIISQNPVMKHIAVIHKNDVYYLPAVNGSAVRITNTPTLYKRMLSMSHNHKKFAFLNGSAIVIVDDSGKQLARLTQYSNVKCFDWSANDETLYILSDNTMYYYGPSMNLPPFTISYPYSSYTTDVLWASVSSKGDFAYVFSGLSVTAGYYTTRLVIKPAGGGADVVYQPSGSDQMVYAAFSSNERDIVVGIAASTYSKSLEKLLFFSGLKNYPDFHIQSSEFYSTPRYNSKEKFMVCGYGSGRSDTLKLSSRCVTNFSKSITRNDFFNENDFLYTDWK